MVAAASGTSRPPPWWTKSFCMSTTTSAVRAGSRLTSAWTSYSGTSIKRLMGDRRYSRSRRLGHFSGSPGRLCVALRNEVARANQQESRDRAREREDRGDEQDLV